MLPKPDKTKKNPKSEQLNLVETLDSAKKIHRKRWWLITTLVLTIGLSLVFYLYYSFSRIVTIKTLPHFSFSSPRSPIPKDYPNWSIYLKSGSSVWLQNFDTDPQGLIADLSQTPRGSDHLLRDTLPSGVDVKEIQNESWASYQITVPVKTIIILVRYPPGEKSRLPLLVKKIYWNVIGD